MGFTIETRNRPEYGDAFDGTPGGRTTSQHVPKYNLLPRNETQSGLASAIFPEAMKYRATLADSVKNMPEYSTLQRVQQARALTPNAQLNDKYGAPNNQDRLFQGENGKMSLHDEINQWIFNDDNASRIQNRIQAENDFNRVVNANKYLHSLGINK